jgi:hypothetical protein
LYRVVNKVQAAMDGYGIEGSPRRGVWKRRLLLVAGVVVAVVWLLILPLPGPMAGARHRFLTEGADAPAAGQTGEQRTSSFFDGAQRVVSFDGPSGKWEMQVNSCASGQMHAFYGVSLGSEQQPNLAVNVVLPEDGAGHITVKTTDGMLERIPKEQCSVWDVAIDRDGTVANSVYEVAGHARFVCSVPESNTHVTGYVTMKRCNY